MGIQFRGRDSRGTTQEKAYAKLAFLMINWRNKVLDVWFNNYPSREIRDMQNPDFRKSGVFKFYGQSRFTLNPNPVPARLQYTGSQPLDIANEDVRAILADTGISMTGILPIHNDQVELTQERRDLLASINIQVVNERVPSFDEFGAENAETAGSIDALITGFLQGQNTEIRDEATDLVCPNGVQTKAVLYVDMVEFTVTIETDNYVSQEALDSKATDPTITKCSTSRYVLTKDAVPPVIHQDENGNTVVDKPGLPSALEFLTGAASQTTNSIESLAFAYAKTREPYLSGNPVDILDNPPSWTTTTTQTPVTTTTTTPAP